MGESRATPDMKLRTAAGAYRVAQRKKSFGAKKEGLADALRLTNEALKDMREEWKEMIG